MGYEAVEAYAMKGLCKEEEKRDSKHMKKRCSTNEPKKKKRLLWIILRIIKKIHPVSTIKTSEECDR